MAKGHVKKTSWKKGQSGNPKGRPKKGLTITDEMERLLEQMGKNGEFTYKQMLVQATMKSALKGNVQAQRLIWERMERPDRDDDSELSKLDRIVVALDKAMRE